MDLLAEFKEKAKANKRRIVLPEGNELRTLKGAAQAAEEGLAEPILLGDAAEIRDLAAKEGISLDGLTIIDIASSADLPAFAEQFYELRKHKGMTPEKAYQQMQEETFFGTMMMKKNEADGMVSGAIHSTADTLRPALQIIKTKKGVTTASSCFVMECPNTAYGQNGVLIFADCAVNIEPDAQQLAAIAIASAETAKTIAEIDEPKVAMLSYSTKGSGKGPSVDLVRNATVLAKEMAPDVAIDGEMQFDAAVSPVVGQLKFPGSKVAGYANTFIFPEIQSGNIGYKIAQRLGGFAAYGPILQGLNAPINDLSRGCDAEEVYQMSIITAALA